MRSSLSVIIVATAIVLFSLWNYAGVKTDFAAHQGGYHYQQMIRADSAPAPYCYRWLVPVLSFRVIGLAYFWMAIGIIGAGVGIHILTRELGGSSNAAWFAMLAFLLWTHIFMEPVLWFSVADPVAWCSIVWAAIFGLRRRLVAAVVAISVGVLSRDLALISIPFVLAVNKDQGRRLALLAVPVALWLAAIVLIHPSVAVIANEDTLSIFKRFGAIHKIRAGGVLLSWSWFWKSFAVIGPLFAAGIAGVKDRRILLYLLVAGMVFLAGDSVRMVTFALACLFPVTGIGFERLVPVKYQVVAATLLLGYHAVSF